MLLKIGVIFFDSIIERIQSVLPVSFHRLTRMGLLAHETFSNSSDNTSAIAFFKRLGGPSEVEIHGLYFISASTLTVSERIKKQTQHNGLPNVQRSLAMSSLKRNNRRAVLVRSPKQSVFDLALVFVQEVGVEVGNYPSQASPNCVRAGQAQLRRELCSMMRAMKSRAWLVALLPRTMWSCLARHNRTQTAPTRSRAACPCI